MIFYWLRRQLQSVVSAARVLESGRAPPRLPETGPEEIRELSRGFNRLAANLEALEADRRLMLVGISHDLATPLTRLRLGLELLQIKGDLTQVAGMVHDVEDMNAIRQLRYLAGEAPVSNPPLSRHLACATILRHAVSHGTRDGDLLPPCQAHLPR